jgi:hypothetical protein
MANRSSSVFSFVLVAIVLALVAAGCAGDDSTDEDGTVHVADPAGALPDGDACLEATPDDSYTLAVLLPASPEDLDEPTQLDTVSQVGVGIDGVTIF